MIRENDELLLKPADRYARAIAALVDLLIVLIFSITISYAVGVFNLIVPGEEPPLIASVLIVVIALLVYTAVNFRLLKKNGQTIGKKINNIRIVNADGETPSLTTLIFRRFLPMLIFLQVPMIGIILFLMNAFWVFGSSSRCLHDLIAGTLVVYD